MKENNVESVGHDVIKELANVDFESIAMSDIIGYLTTFGKNLLIALIVYFIGSFLIKYATKALKAIAKKRNMEPSLTSFLDSLVYL